MKAGLILIFLTTVGCSTTKMSWKNQTYTTMATSALVGGLAGSSLTPDGDNKSAHGMLWGAAASSIAAITMIALKDDKDSFQEKERRRVEELLNNDKNKSKPLMQMGKNLFESPIPKEMQNVISPGQWKKYKVDVWEQDQSNPNVWFHKDLMFEIIPPQIK